MAGTATDRVLSVLTAASTTGVLTASDGGSPALDLYFTDTYVSDVYGAVTVTAGILGAASAATSQQMVTQATGGPG
jgi:hypothetical protein